jgi:2-polyprenyl-3-methyl-5-hydroxy-6-metoxy-1,4-benzoquinol methylase
MPKGRVGVFLLSVNDAQSLPETLDAFSQSDGEHVVDVFIVANDSHASIRDARRLAPTQREEACIPGHPTRHGEGDIHKAICRYAVESGIDFVAILPELADTAMQCAQALVAPLLRGEAQVSIGEHSSQPRVRSSLRARIQARLAGMGPLDFASEYRAYSLRLLRTLPVGEASDGRGFRTEILLQARQSGARIQPVRLPPCPRRRSRPAMDRCLDALSSFLASVRYGLFRKGLLYSSAFDVALMGPKYTGKFDDPYSSHSLIYAKLGALGLKEKRVLEIGVGDGSLTKKLFELGALVDCVEIDPGAIELARPFCRRVYLDSLEHLDKIGLTDRYHVIVMADVLEHIAEPIPVLRAIGRYLRSGGMLVVSLPNVANIYVRLNLLFGRFPYAAKGILDRTHLRFYTFETARRLLTDTGWTIQGRDAVPIPLSLLLPFLLRRPFRFILAGAWHMTKMWKGLLAYQHIFYCRKAGRVAGSS